MEVHAGTVACEGACWDSGMSRCMLGEWRVEVHAGRVACRGACQGACWEWRVEVHAGRVACQGACWGSGMSRCMLGVACGGACWDSGMSRCMLGEWHVKVHAGRVACGGACWDSGMSRCMLGEWRVEQGSYGAWKSLNSMEFHLLKIKALKAWNFVNWHGKPGILTSRISLGGRALKPCPPGVATCTI